MAITKGAFVLKIMFLLTILLSFLANQINALSPEESKARQEVLTLETTLNSQANTLDTRCTKIESDIQRLESLLSNLQQSTPSTSQATTPITSTQTTQTSQTTQTKANNKALLSKFRTNAVKAAVLESLIKTYLLADTFITNRFGRTFSGKTPEQLLKDINANEKGTKTYDEYYKKAIKELPQGSKMQKIFADPESENLIVERLAATPKFLSVIQKGTPLSKISQSERISRTKSFINQEVSRRINNSASLGQKSKIPSIISPIS